MSEEWTTVIYDYYYILVESLNRITYLTTYLSNLLFSIELSPFTRSNPYFHSNILCNTSTLLGFYVIKQKAKTKKEKKCLFFEGSYNFYL